MDWLTGNSFFLVIIMLCVGMHLFHGHGGHGGSAENDDHANDDHAKTDDVGDDAHRHH